MKLPILFSLLPNDDTKKEYIKKIKKRFEKIPNTGYMEIWLQYMQLNLVVEIDFKEAICKLVDGNNENIWNLDWISSNDLKSLLNSKNIIDNNKIKKGKLQPVIPIKEIELFISKINES